MKKTYKIEVDCANCANKMEEATKKTAGVQNATVNFMTQKMEVEFAEGADDKAVMKAYGFTGKTDEEVTKALLKLYKKLISEK